ncbi:hypothetical protein FHS96_003020 [Sphingomonas zeicaulis]|uniref:hypothetical protein n=1 Tax=Sphingomonas zeicaulis TaxID=1632740 RepID=UPI003D1B6425
MRRKRAMTGWYDPAQLAQTGIRVAISTVFGQFADKREALAAANAIAPQPFDESFDYSTKGADGFWLDFVADTGDGWNSTYAIARLLSAKSLTIGEDVLPRGRVLMMGGDQVYPTASRAEYEDRLLAPFEAAHEAEAQANGWPEKEARPDLYAIPGNHDWYDGLNAFFGLFCRRRIAIPGAIGQPRAGRPIAGWETHQTRSYFALQLPGGWWLWGTDSQLEGYIDQPQIEYFRHAARYWMPKGSKLILCVGTPSWQYVDEEDPDPGFASFSYLERLAGVEEDDNGEPMGHQLRLVLTGDSHHYVRFVEGDRHYITSGGGGAFLHPTQQVTDKNFTSEFPEPGVRHRRGNPRTPRSFKVAQSADGTPAVYPAAATSRLLTFWNLLFAFKNWKFPLLLTPAYALFIWILDFNARLGQKVGLGDALFRGGSLWRAVELYWQFVIASPLAPLLLGVTLAGYHFFADVKNGLGRFTAGAVHAAASAAAVTVTTCLLARAACSIWPAELKTLTAFAQQIGLIAGIGFVSAVVSATIFGLYLLVMLLVFSRHSNEAFSSIGHRGYKGFLRLRIGTDGALTLYPIGLTKVPWDRGATPRNPPLSPHLIEGPIRIPADAPVVSPAPAPPPTDSA